MTPGKTPLLDKWEAQARNQIELHAPQKLQELARIEKSSSAVSRSVQTQMLLHSENVDGMKSVLTSHFPALQNADAHALGSLINIYKANPTVEARSALVRLMPLLGKLPEGARNFALEQLNSMLPQDLQRSAQRLADSPTARMNAFDDATGMQLARWIFGRNVPATSLRTGAAGDAASDAAKPKASLGGDATDTIRMQKGRGGESSGPSDASNASGAPRDLYAEAMKRLPEAQRRLAESKAQRGIPDHIVGMAAPGGPSSSTQRQMIDSWLAEPSLGLDEGRMLMRMLFDEHPVLNDLVAVQGATAGPELRAQLNGIMRRFAAEAGVSITVVQDGVVQRARKEGDYGSMRSRPGHYEIEQSVFNDDVRLRRELTHQITAYLGSQKVTQEDWKSPIVVNRNAAVWLESCVEQGGPPSDE
jgi:hypothetical protein